MWPRSTCSTRLAAATDLPVRPRSAARWPRARDASPRDFAFGVLLADLADNPGFAEIARQHYDARRATFGGATGFGTAIRDGRHARHEDGLIAYDVGWLSISAAALDAAFPGAGYGA